MVPDDPCQISSLLEADRAHGCGNRNEHKSASVEQVPEGLRSFGKQQPIPGTLVKLLVEL